MARTKHAHRRTRPAEGDRLLDLSHSRIATLPRKVDLRDRAATGLWPVWDQGEITSCTAHAVAGLVAYDRIVRRLEPEFQPSRRFIYACEQAEMAKHGVHLTGTVPYAMEVVRQHGYCVDAKVAGLPESVVWPYTEDVLRVEDPPSRACFEFARRHADSHARFYLSQDLDHLRACVAEGNPFAISIAVFEDGVLGKPGPGTTHPGTSVVSAKGDIALPTAAQIDRSTKDGSGASVGLYGCHAVVVIGYDDSRKRFVIRNSLGPDWGAAGHGTIPYDYVTNPVLCDQGWMMQPIPGATPGLPRGK